MKEAEQIYTTLEHTDLKVIHEAFVSAFSDYYVKFDMPFEKFESFLKGKGFEPSLSAGAFTEGKLCGFILNGLRMRQGIKTAYDGGTGVVPEMRRQGLTTGMLGFCLPLLKENGVKRYVLEVLKQNEQALRLYERFGFSVTRSLICYRTQKEKLPTADTADIEIIDVTDIDEGAILSFQDYLPAWQNTLESVLATPQQCAAAVASSEGETAGYGIINAQSGRIYQLAVSRGRRGQGIGLKLLRKLAQQTDSPVISMLNVDGGCGSMNGFLSACGFEVYAEQYEMELEI